MRVRVASVLAVLAVGASSAPPAEAVAFPIEIASRVDVNCDQVVDASGWWRLQSDGTVIDSVGNTAVWRMAAGQLQIRYTVGGLVEYIGTRSGRRFTGDLVADHIVVGCWTGRLR